MKIEHSISDYQGEILSKDAGKAVLKFDKNYFNNYKNEDFNEHFVVQALLAFNLLEKLSIGHYSVYKSIYLYDKAICQPAIAITGEDVDIYTHLCMLEEKLKLYNRTSATPDEIAWIMKELEKYYPAEKIAETKANPQEISTLIYHKKSPIWQSFQKKTAPNPIRTFEWKRKKDAQNREVFDYSLPATLFLNTVTFDEKEYKKLDDVVKHILLKYEINHQTDSLTISVEFQNIQPKPKKTKIPPMDFESLKGKKIDAYHYFNTLTELFGWKYDKEESDLFCKLSKTF
ncbi:MAG: hypothetical protein MUC49_15250 [Raineya sp.]|jgi:hypothetical protein|nr:hypothetical protein [Raineya sp.]